MTLSLNQKMSNQVRTYIFLNVKEQTVVGSVDFKKFQAVLGTPDWFEVWTPYGAMGFHGDEVTEWRKIPSVDC